MKTNLEISLLFLLLLSSCSSVITREDCKKSMSELGFSHGNIGLKNLSREVRSQCSDTPELDLFEYEKGFKTGWNSFCTSFQGYEMGKKGEEFRSYCPPEKEKLFHEKFLIGKKVYEKNDQVTELEEKISGLKRDMEKHPSAALKDELKKNQDYLLSLKREIQALEQQGLSLISTNPL